MEAIFGTLQAIAVFLVGLLARVGLVLAVIAVLLAPVMVVMAAVRGWETLRLRFLGLRSAGGFLYRRGVYYAPGHTWLKPEAGRLRIGIDDLAQRLLPWAVSVDLPKPGTEVREGEPVAAISCGEQVVRIAAPVDGRIVAVNPSVARDPSLVKRDNYARGWLFAVAPKGERHLALPIDDVARSWLASEGGRLARFFEQQFGIAAADGGEWMAPPPSMLGAEQWKSLTRAFLRV
jgi:glycine cleavage system H protein